MSISMNRFASLIIIAAIYFPAFSQDNADLIFKKAIDQLLVNNMELSIEQKERDKKGREKEKSFDLLMAKFGEAEKTKITMQKPERAAGVTILVTRLPKEDGIIEVFTPANGKTRKMIASPKNMALAGADFSMSGYASMNREELGVKLLEKEDFEGRSCYKLEVEDKTNDEGGKAELLIEENTFHIVQIESYNPNGIKNSISKLSDFQKINGIKNKFQPMLIVTDDIENKNHTEIRVLKISPRPDLKEKDFSLENRGE